MKSIRRKPQLLKKYGLIFLRIGPVGFFHKIKSVLENKHFHISLLKDYAVWVTRNYPSPSLLERQRTESKKFSHTPLISIIMPTYNTNEDFLRECIDSVLDQSYPHWELCIADDASPNKNVSAILETYSKQDSRIKYLIRTQNGHICEASNSALTLATGEFISLLDHDDVLWPNALFEIVKKINQNPSAGLLYSDEDKLEEYTHVHTDPFFKPDYNFDYLRSINYITHFSTFKKEIIDALGGFRKGYEGSQDWDLILRATHYIETNTELTIEHIPTIIYSWRKSATSTASEKYGDTVKSYAYISQKKTLEDDLTRRNIKGEVLETKYLGSWRVRYAIAETPLISIIIPTKNHFDLLKKCIESIMHTTQYPQYEIIVVDNNSNENNALAYLKKLEKGGAKVIRHAGSFNFSKQCNLGAAHARGKYFVFLNNDTEIHDPEWLKNLLEHAQRHDIGMVGGKLLYPNMTIQSMGIVWVESDYKNDVYVAIHPGKGMNDETGQGFPASHYKDSVRQVSAVSAACCMIEKEKFESVAGFDEILPVAFNDVDLCLRLNQKGLRTIYTPYACIIHHESATLGDLETQMRDKKQFLRDVRMFEDLWPLVEEKFLNENITRNKVDFSLRI